MCDYSKALLGERAVDFEEDLSALSEPFEFGADFYASSKQIRDALASLDRFGRKPDNRLLERLYAVWQRDHDVRPGDSKHERGRKGCPREGSLGLGLPRSEAGPGEDMSPLAEKVLDALPRNGTGRLVYALTDGIYGVAEFVDARSDLVALALRELQTEGLVEALVIRGTRTGLWARTKPPERRSPRHADPEVSRDS